MTRRPDVAPDGSPVAIYRALPAEPEFTPVLDDLTGGASVLDLGCGTGRLANLLAARGHPVTGVDASEAMLRHLDPAVVAVHAPIEALRLPDRFEVVVLASHFVNTADTSLRRAVLTRAAAHVTPSGRVYIEHYNPARGLSDGEGEIGPVHVSLRVLDRDGNRVRARARYQLREEEWSQEFRAEILDDGELDGELHRAGLERTARLSDTWLSARPVRERPADRIA